jgi:hypothetical protein
MGALHGSHSHLKSGTSQDAKRITNQLILDALSPPLPIPFSPPVSVRHDPELLDSIPESIEGGADALLQVSLRLYSSLCFFFTLFLFLLLSLHSTLLIFTF